MIGLLLWLLVFVVVLYVVFLVIGYMGLPEPVRKIAVLVVGLIFLLVLLQRLGFVPL